MRHHLSDRALRAKERNHQRLSESSLVSADERTEKLAAELLDLSPESQDNLRELIRLYHHTEEGIDKRRLLTEPSTGGDPVTPGDEYMAAMLIDLNRDVDRFNSRERKRRQRAREVRDQDLGELIARYKRRLEGIEGYHDPDRVIERLKRRREPEVA